MNFVESKSNKAKLCHLRHITIQKALFPIVLCMHPHWVPGNQFQQTLSLKRWAVPSGLNLLQALQITYTKSHRVLPCLYCAPLPCDPGASPSRWKDQRVPSWPRLGFWAVVLVQSPGLGTEIPQAVQHSQKKVEKLFIHIDLGYGFGHVGCSNASQIQENTCILGFPFFFLFGTLRPPCQKD